MPDEHGDLVALQARRQEARCRLELSLRLPEVGDVIPQRDERITDAERQARLARSEAARSSAPEQPEHACRVGGQVRRRLLPEPLERTQHEPHLADLPRED